MKLSPLSLICDSSGYDNRMNVLQLFVSAFNCNKIFVISFVIRRWLMLMRERDNSRADKHQCRYFVMILEKIAILEKHL